MKKEIIFPSPGFLTTLEQVWDYAKRLSGFYNSFLLILTFLQNFVFLPP